MESVIKVNSCTETGIPEHPAGTPAGNALKGCRKGRYGLVVAAQTVNLERKAGHIATDRAATGFSSLDGGGDNRRSVRHQAAVRTDNE